MLGKNACLGHDGHEGVISIPAGNKVNMQMLLDPGTGRLADVHTDIESVRFEGLL